MDPDQEICLCFRVTRRKLDRYLRLEKPQRAAQLSECFGAGTGCGWCRRYLVAMFDAAQQDGVATDGLEIPEATTYAEMRKQFRQSRPETLPGESPVDGSAEPDSAGPDA